MSKQPFKLPKPWTVELRTYPRPSRDSGWITNQKTGKAQSFICYDDGTTAFDNPLALPKGVRKRAENYCRRLH